MEFGHLTKGNNVLCKVLQGGVLPPFFLLIVCTRIVNPVKISKFAISWKG